MSSPTAPVVVTGANGLVGSRISAVLVERGVPVPAVARRTGAAPELPGVEETVGDFSEPDFAATVVSGASARETSTSPRAWSATTETTMRSPGATPTWRSPRSTASRACSCVRRPSSDLARRRSGTPAVPKRRGRILADRARGWGWSPTVDLAQALAEIVAGLPPGP